MIQFSDVYFWIVLVDAVISREDFLHFHVTHTPDELFPEFIKDKMHAFSLTYCGLFCIQHTYCKSFNYHAKFSMCNLLVTDSRLLGQESILGKLLIFRGCK